MLAACSSASFLDRSETQREVGSRKQLFRTGDFAGANSRVLILNLQDEPILFIAIDKDSGYLTQRYAAIPLKKALDTLGHILPRMRIRRLYMVRSFGL